MTLNFASQITSDSLDLPTTITLLNGLGSFVSLLPRIEISATYDASAVTTNSLICCVSLSSAISVTLPKATMAGQIVIIMDESGSCSTTNTITISRTSTDTINGSASSYVLNTSYGYVMFISKNSSSWYAIVEAYPVAVLDGSISATTFNSLSASNYDCNGSCSWTCSTTCVNSCNNSCLNQCTNGCTTGCQSSCSGCSGDCTTACTSNCSTSCVSGCSSTCLGANL